MKRIIACLMLIGTSYCTMAQDGELLPITESKPTFKKNEIGLTAELDVFRSPNSSTAFQAIQYKHWKNEHFGARFLLGRRDYYDNASWRASYQVSNDTIISRTPITNGGVGIAGIGLEAQRQFYKRVYLFAAVEAKFGYGKATIDTIVERSIENNTNRYLSPPPPTATPGRPANNTDVYYASLVPTFGAKFQFNRISFGSEMALNLLNYSYVNNKVTPGVGTLDFDLGRLNPRFFIQYRF